MGVSGAGRWPRRSVELAVLGLLLLILGVPATPALGAPRPGATAPVEPVVWLEQALWRAEAVGNGGVTASGDQLSPSIDSEAAAAGVMLDVPAFDQWDYLGDLGWLHDPIWSGGAFGSFVDPFGGFGDDVTALAMVLRYHGVDTDPRRLNTSLLNTDGFDAATLGSAFNLTWSPSSLGYVSGGKVRLVSSGVPDWGQIDDDLSAGRPVIAYLLNPDTLPPQWGWSVIVGKQDGLYYVNTTRGEKAIPIQSFYPFGTANVDQVFRLAADGPAPPPDDITAPVTTASGYDAAWHSSPVTVSFTATDPPPNASGVAYTEYRLDSGAWTRGTSCRVAAPANTKAISTISHRSADNAGNIEAYKTCQVKIDTTIEPPPSSSEFCIYNASNGRAGMVKTDGRWVVWSEQDPEIFGWSRDGALIAKNLETGAVVELQDSGNAAVSLSPGEEEFHVSGGIVAGGGTVWWDLPSGAKHQCELPGVLSTEGASATDTDGRSIVWTTGIWHESGRWWSNYMGVTDALTGQARVLYAGEAHSYLANWISSPCINGDTVYFWYGYKIWSLPLAGGQQPTLVLGPLPINYQDLDGHGKLATSGDYLVWEESAAELHCYNLRTGQDTPILSWSDGYGGSWDLRDDTVVWRWKDSDWHTPDEIRATDLQTGVTVTVSGASASPSWPATADGLVVWLDQRNFPYPGDGPSLGGGEVWGKRIAPAATCTITSSSGAGGTISPYGSHEVQPGGSLSFTMTPKTGFTVKDVLVDGTSVGAVTSYAFTNIRASHTIAVTFTKGPFAPNPDGWRFPNGEDVEPFDDGVVWIRLFGWGARSLARFAFESKLLLDGVFSHGNCLGFAASSASYYTGLRDLSAVVPGLDLPYEWGPDRPGYPLVDSDGNSIMGVMDVTVRQEIEQFQLTQYEASVATAIGATQISASHPWWAWGAADNYAQALTQWTNQLRAAVLCEPQIIVLGSKSPSEGTGGGHAVLAYRCDVSGSGRDQRVLVSVYDSNHPGDPHRYIDVHPAQGTWEFRLFPNRKWSSADGGGAIAYLSADSVAAAANSSSPRPLDGETLGVFDAATAVLSDAQGRTSGFSPSGESWEIPGVLPWMPSTFTSGAEAPAGDRFRVPDPGAVSLSVAPDAAGAYSAMLPAAGTDLYVGAGWNGGARRAAATTDSLQLTADGRGLTFEPGGAVSARVVLAGDSGAESLAVDMAFAQGASAAGGRTAGATSPSVEFRLVPTSSGVAVDIADAGAVGAGRVLLSFAGGGKRPIAAPADSRVRVELSGGEASGQEGVAAAMTIKTDTDQDGDWDTTTTGTLPASPEDSVVDFDPPKPVVLSDTTPPITTAAGYDANWHSTPVTVTFSSTDPAPDVSGVAYTEYRLDSGAWIRGTSCLVPAPAATKMTHTVDYRSADLAGNVEVAKSCQVKIDTTVQAPIIALTVNGASASGIISPAGDADWYSFTVTSTGSYTIETQAGTLTDSYMYLYGPYNQTTLIDEDDDGGVGTMAQITRTLNPGTYYVKVRAYADGTGTYTIRVDTATPPPPDDTVGPVCSAMNVSVKRGKSCNLRFRVVDDQSDDLYVRVVITSRSGVVKKRWSWDGLGSYDDWRYLPYKCRLARGTYRIVITARDGAGNSQSRVGRATLRVR